MKVISFVTKFTPDITPTLEGRAINARTLRRHNPDLSFSVEEVEGCLSAYLQLMDEGVAEVVEFIERSEPKLDLSNYADVIKLIHGILRSWHHMEASELMQVYLSFAPYNDISFITFLDEIDAINRVNRFIHTIDPHKLHPHLDTFKRVVEVHETLLRIVK